MNRHRPSVPLYYVYLLPRWSSPILPPFLKNPFLLSSPSFDRGNFSPLTMWYAARIPSFKTAHSLPLASPVFGFNLRLASPPPPPLSHAMMGRCSPPSLYRTQKGSPPSLIFRPAMPPSARRPCPAPVLVLPIAADAVAVCTTEIRQIFNRSCENEKVSFTLFHIAVSSPVR